ncbi:glycerophosphodiester phosphodiesterase [Sphingomonas ginkgonis]|uniref:Glycerophosphodiester phosphodiesterase n=1 Tax=Sphingomonas ginkgonis TaxID=2315330 RepID=A0A429V7B3_9SPHN|nr:glycerophosphodiester phosphodiesterase family protein [Sphingomonas ginkgonis]RST29838.1 glycerophosphodiester phosphodiesterase [Sphingomonas ginkgonis]
MKWTRSSPSAPDPLAPGPGGFAHRGLHGPDAPENSFRAFGAALERRCGIECDLRLTRDGQVLVFHDRDAVRLCGSALVIGERNAAELDHLRVGGQPIPTLLDLLQQVAGRVPLLLEVKVEQDLMRWMLALKPLLGRYKGPFGVMSFDPRLVRLARINLPRARTGLVVAAELPGWRRRLALALASPDFLAVDVAAIEQGWVARARRRMPVYSWTVRTRKQRQQVAVHADAPIWEGDGRP